MTYAAVFKNRYFHLAAILLLVLVIYGNSLDNGFNIDDPALLLNNPAVHGFSGNSLLQVFTTVPNGVEYLPLRDLTYCLDYSLWGTNPFGYHLANLIYYSISCVLLYLLFAKLLAPWTAYHAETAFFAAILFAVHPVHVESVAGIAQRKDLVSAIFFFLSIYLFLFFKEGRDWRFYLLSLLFFVCAFLAKATVVILPLLLFLLDAYYPGEKESGIGARLVRSVPYLIIALILTLVQVAILRDAGIIKSELAGQGNEYAIRIFTAAKAVFYYLRLLITANPLNIMHDFDYARQLLTPKVFFSVVGLCGVLYGIISLRKRCRTLSLAGAWYLVCLLPVVGLIPTATLVAERYLFLPSAGFCLAVGYLLSLALKQSSLRIAATAVFSLLVLFFTATAQSRTHVWKNSLTLYQAGIKGYPENPRLHWLAGRDLFGAKKYEEAFKSFSTAQSLDPSYAIDYQLFLAIRAYDEKNYPLALLQLERISLPANIFVRDIDYLYGRIYAATGELDKARNYYRRAAIDQIELGIYYKNDALTALQGLGVTSE